MACVFTIYIVRTDGAFSAKQNELNEEAAFFHAVNPLSHRNQTNQRFSVPSIEDNNRRLSSCRLGQRLLRCILRQVPIAQNRLRDRHHRRVVPPAQLCEAVPVPGHRSGHQHVVRRLVRQFVPFQ